VLAEERVYLRNGFDTTHDLQSGTAVEETVKTFPGEFGHRDRYTIVTVCNVVSTVEINLASVISGRRCQCSGMRRCDAVF
jgi:hypothetical protein